MKNKKLKVGFIGLGLMGNPMAKNILKSGFPLSVYNRTKSKTLEFKKLGAEVYDSPASLASQVDVVITVVTGPKDVRQVIMGKNGIAEGLKNKGVIIDMSTIGVVAAMEIGEDLKECGISFLDAPVTGGTTGAENGTLSIFVGGDKKIFEEMKILLEVMGKNIHYMGKAGLGQATKLVNNLIVGETTAALAESFILAESLGLTRKQVAAALENVFAVSPAMKAKMPSMIANKFPVSFSIANIRKDLKLAKDENKSYGTKENLPILAGVEKLYKKGLDQGMENEDVAAVVRIIKGS